MLPTQPAREGSHSICTATDLKLHPTKADFHGKNHSLPLSLKCDWSSKEHFKREKVQKRGLKFSKVTKKKGEAHLLGMRDTYKTIILDTSLKGFRLGFKI